MTTEASTVQIAPPPTIDVWKKKHFCIPNSLYIQNEKEIVFGKEKENLLKIFSYIFLETYALNAPKVKKFYTAKKLQSKWDISALNECLQIFFFFFKYEGNIK